MWNQKCLSLVFLGCNLRQHCYISNQHFRISQTGKFCKKNRNFLNLGPKMAYLCVFRMLYQAVTFETGTLEFSKYGFSNNTENFGIGSAFIKDPASPFSEGPGPDQGPRFKGCRLRAVERCHNCQR